MDTITLQTNLTGLTESGAASTGSTLSTGDLRRRFNFGSMVTELNPQQDPYFRIMSLFRRKPTDDPEFKFTEKRNSWNKRYAYVVNHGTTSAITADGSDATITAANVTAGSTYYFNMQCDYKRDGLIGNVYGQSTGAITVGDAGTGPKFFIPGQVVKINTGSAYNVMTDYMLARIDEVTEADTYAILKTTIVKAPGASALELQWYSATTAMPSNATLYASAIANAKTDLESKRSYVVGTAFGRGTGYPDNWIDNPYSTGYGYTQIFKTTLGMDNTTRATVLKYEPNEWARMWKEKLIEHKWDIETAFLFGDMYKNTVDGTYHTQCIVEYCLAYGNVFTYSSTMTADDFLDHMSQFMDVRIGNSKVTLFMTDKPTYNWLNQLSGYHMNNIQIAPNYKTDFAFAGRGNVGGVAVNKISTIWGDINFTYNPHLDGTGVRIVAVNTNHTKIRPLVGNGLNRDTYIETNVQENGVDKRIDQILTEIGQECSMPESHAVWK